jgi:hypothetical protein
MTHPGHVLVTRASSSAGADAMDAFGVEIFPDVGRSWAS